MGWSTYWKSSNFALFVIRKKRRKRTNIAISSLKKKRRKRRIIAISSLISSSDWSRGRLFILIFGLNIHQHDCKFCHFATFVKLIGIQQPCWLWDKWLILHSGNIFPLLPYTVLLFSAANGPVEQIRKLGKNVHLLELSSSFLTPSKL